MFVSKYLYLNGERFEVLSFEFSCYRSTGYEGEPTSEIKGITLRLRIRSNYDNTLYKAMIQQYSLLQGKLVFERENEGSKEIIFIDAVISHFEESFTASGEYPMNIYIEIRPRNMRYDGIDFRDRPLRAGEPDRLGEYCKHEQAKPQEVVKQEEDSNCPHCRKEHVDLRAKVIFEPQKSFDDCKKTCDKIVKRHTKHPSEGAGEKLKNDKQGVLYQLLLEDEARKNLIPYSSKFDEAIEYLDTALDIGYSIVVGVHHTYDNKNKEGKPYNEGTTDHFVIIVGRGCEEGKTCYHFWDVGTADGKTRNDKFILTPDKRLVCNNTYRLDKKPYHVTQIRRLVKDPVSYTILTLKDLHVLKAVITR